MHVSRRVRRHVSRDTDENHTKRQLGKPGPGSYLVRQGTIYVFQMRLPKDLGGGGRTRPLRLSLGACPFTRARFLADVLAAEARLFFGRLRMKTGSDTGGMSLQPQDLLEEGVLPEENLTALKTYLKVKLHDLNSAQDHPTDPQQQAGLAALKGLMQVQKQTRAKEQGESYVDLVVENADLLIEKYKKDLATSVSADPVVTVAARPEIKVPLPEIPPIAAPAAIAQVEPGPEVPLAVWVRTVGKRMFDEPAAFELDRRLVPRKFSTKPKFSRVAGVYLKARQGAKTSKNKDIETARSRFQLFVDIIGDHPVDTYEPADIQAYVNALQYWPAKLSNRPEGAAALDVIAGNLDRRKLPIALNTLKDGYVTIIKTAIKYGVSHYAYDYPLTGMTLHYPEIARRAQPAQPLSFAKISRVLATGVSSGLMEEAMLPLLGLLTGRRLGLLLHMRGSDIREKFSGVWVVHTESVRCVDGVWIREPHKTDASLTFFVLHKFFSEIGFVEWAVAQGDSPLFPNLTRLEDPSKSGSQYMGRLFARAGIEQNRQEVFHSLRGGFIEEARDQAVDPRSRKLQAGHELGADEHELYGFRTLTELQARGLADMRLNPEIDFTMYRGIDFSRMAQAQRVSGRRRSVDG
ncbi:hypothetical protein [Pseudorhizobium flavum]|uniref:hypothetical protein n=1 Tax=Pseudorhizobium flavum TaxID=1335061 RepID=UPI0024939512|nr:hypothetical protein [Pseudorhizobium flavum]